MYTYKRHGKKEKNIYGGKRIWNGNNQERTLEN